MKINHPNYNVEIDTEKESIKDVLDKLEETYQKLPETKCLNCPMKETVEADCCKVFSPPMLLSEFTNAMTIITEWTKEDQDKLAYACFESFLNPDIAKPCVLLKGTLCSIYNSRPLSCRLFGIYSDFEYNERLEKISKELNVPKEDIPFSCQCRNLEVKTKGKGNLNFVSKQDSDKIFESLYKLDAKMFDSKEYGEYIVNFSLTYMPFDAHYLCVRIGPDNLDILTDMKLMLRDAKKKYEANKEDSTLFLEFSKKEKEVQEFLKTVKNSLFIDTTD